MDLHPDFKDLLAAFAHEKVRYLLIGGYAVAFHSRPRFTKDIDLWVGVEPENLESVCRAFALFGAPPHILETLRTLGPTEILYMGRPPARVDLLRSISDMDFEQAYERRVETEWDGVPVSIISLDDLILAKRAAGRAQDQLDLDALEQVTKHRRRTP